MTSLTLGLGSQTFKACDKISLKIERLDDLLHASSIVYLPKPEALIEILRVDRHNSNCPAHVEVSLNVLRQVVRTLLGGVDKLQTLASMHDEVRAFTFATRDPADVQDVDCGLR